MITALDPETLDKEQQRLEEEEDEIPLYHPTRLVLLYLSFLLYL